MIVDDDPVVRGSLECLIRSVGLSVRGYGSAQDVLDAPLPDVPCCLVVDVRMPHIGGFEFRDRLVKRGLDIPMVFVTGHGDILMSVKAMKAGAVDFLTKPFRDQDMLDAVNVALARAIERRAASEELAGSRSRYASLTPREKQVMEGVTQGLLNKQIAGELGITEITVKLHRSSVMKKMALKTVADLVRVAEALQHPDPRP